MMRACITISIVSVLGAAQAVSAQTCEDAGSGPRAVFGDTASDADTCTLGGAGAYDKLYKVTLTEGDWLFTMAPSDEDWDSVLYVSDSSCCASDVASVNNNTLGGHEEVTVTVPANGPFVYYFGVDGASAVEEGPFILSATEVGSELKYQVIDLGVLNNEETTDPLDIGTFGINNKGQVASAYAVNNVLRGRVYLPADAYGRDAGFVELSTAFGPEAIARDINESGIAVGQVKRLGAQYPRDGGIKRGEGRGAFWDLTSGTTPVPATQLGFLDTTGLNHWSRVHAVNDSSPPIIVGEAGADDSCISVCGLPNDKAATHAFSVAATPPFTLTEFPPLPQTAFECHPSTLLRDINNAVQYAGFADVVLTEGACLVETCVNDARPAVWTDELTVSVPPYPQAGGGHGEGASVRAINDNGQLVGYGVRDRQCNLFDALFWESATDELPVSLTDFVPNTRARAFGMSNEVFVDELRVLRVVGSNDFTDSAVLWVRTDDMWADPAVDLNDEAEYQGYQFTDAHDVNDDGWIVGRGRLGSAIHAFLFIPLGDDHCTGDANDDGMVDFDDLLLVLSFWGECGEGDCPDVTFDGLVDFDDILAVLGNWGPCASGPQPTSIRDLYAAMTLDYPEDWHEYLDVAQDGSVSDVDNYSCWLTHYYNKHVLGCLDPPSCPGSDPWDGTHF